jgi:hypothetical protein
MPSILARTMILILAFSAGASPQVATQTTPNEASLLLTIRILTPVVRSGTPVELHIDIENDGGDDVAVARYFDCISNGPSCLLLTIEDESGEKHESEQFHRWGSPDALLYWWTLVTPLHSYGVHEKLENMPGMATYDFLKRPGRYKVFATYTSKGGYMPPAREDLHIPTLKVWEGKLVSNTASFKVVPARS